MIADFRRAQRRRARRSRLLLATGASAAAVLLVAGVVFLVPGSGSGQSAATAAAPGVVERATNVPKATFDAIGAGTAVATPSAIKAPGLTSHGTPRVFYTGAEYCPYCAAERWALVAALSRFGTFTGLGETTSSSTDVFPDTATLTFHGSTYSSPYLAFTSVETTTNQRDGSGYAPLDRLSTSEQKLVSTYDRPPYVSGQAGAIPFVDIAGQYVSSGASFSPQLLAGMSQEQISRAMEDPTSPVARAIDGTANLFSAAICQATGGHPSTVCTSPGVTAAAQRLDGR